MLGTSARGRGRMASSPCTVGPGTRVRYRGETWEIWALGQDMTVTLLRDGDQKPNFIRARCQEVEVDRAS